MNARTELLKLHDWDELLFGGFYCLHCTPDDEDSFDEPIAWPCPPLREAGVTDAEARALIVAHREKVAAEHQAKKAAELAELQCRVDAFNARYPVGTPVFAYPGCRPEDDRKATRLVTRTRSKATVLSGHTDVVWVDGHSACIALTHVDPVSEGVWEEARAAEQPAEPEVPTTPDRLSPEREAEIAAVVAVYAAHPDLGFACCSAHPVADAVPALLAELAAVRAERDQARADLADQADADTVAARASQAIAAMGAEIRALRSERDRYRSAWQSARERAQAYGEGILRHVADRDTWKRWLKEAASRVAELERPAIEAKRNEIRSSYTELIAQAREAKDYEGAFEVECRLRDREEQWKREDEETVR